MKTKQFKIGDYVQIVKKVENNIEWNTQGYMDRTLGTFSKIIRIYNCSHGEYVNLDNGWNYDVACLKLVKSYKRPKWINIWKN